MKEKDIRKIIFDFNLKNEIKILHLNGRLSKFFKNENKLKYFLNKCVTLFIQYYDKIEKYQKEKFHHVLNIEQDRVLKKEEIHDFVLFNVENSLQVYDNELEDSTNLVLNLTELFIHNEFKTKRLIEALLGKINVNKWENQSNLFFESYFEKKIDKKKIKNISKILCENLRNQICDPSKKYVTLAVFSNLKLLPINVKHVFFKK